MKTAEDSNLSSALVKENMRKVLLFIQVMVTLREPRGYGAGEGLLNGEVAYP